jgi:hypothetical protein
MSFGSAGRFLLLGGGTLLFIDLFLAWQRHCISVGPDAVCGTRPGWSHFGIAVGLAATILVVWEAVRITGDPLLRPGLDDLVSAALGAAVCGSAAVEFARSAELRQWPAWVGLGLAIAIGIGVPLRLAGRRG